jgi:hypothetical protein
MKKTTCKDLRGACDEIITGATPEEMGHNSKKHVVEMVNKGDKAHMDAIKSMMALSEEDQKQWYEEWVKGFDSLADA